MYCVLVNVSKNKVSFWYQIDGDLPSPLTIKDGNEVPLYFYVNGNDFIFGSYARERFFNIDPNAYGNYFNLVTDPSKHFIIYGNQKPVKHLLYVGIEQYLSHFLNSVLYKSESIESYRPEFPLRFMFSSDLEEKERLLVETIFNDAGYDNVSRVSYFDALFDVLSNKNIINKNAPTILLTGLDNNLYVELFFGSFDRPIALKVLKDMGSDPRVKIISEMILEDALIRNPFLTFDKERELSHLIPYAVKILQNDTPIPSGDIILSDGTTVYYKIKLKDLNERLLFYSGEEKIYKYIEEILNENSITVTSVLILLNGASVNTSYFIERLKKKYSNVRGTPPNNDFEVLKLVFKKIASTGYSKINQSISPIPIIRDDKIIQETTSLKPPTPIIPPKQTPPIAKIPTQNKTPPPLPHKNKPPIPSEKNGSQVTGNKISNLVGKTGLALSDLNLEGKIEVDGKVHDATAETINVSKGKRVKIIGLRNESLIVHEIYLPPPIKPPPLPPKKSPPPIVPPKK